MKHLTVDEIIQFVSLTELNSRAIELSSAVNGHIRRCGDCLKLVRAFQMTYDGFCGLGADGDLRYDPEQAGLAEKASFEAMAAADTAQEDFEGFR